MHQSSLNGASQCDGQRHKTQRGQVVHTKRLRWLIKAVSCCVYEMFEVFVTLSLYCPRAPGMNEFVVNVFFIGNSPLFSLTQDIGYDAFFTKKPRLHRRLQVTQSCVVSLIPNSPEFASASHLGRRAVSICRARPATTENTLQLNSSGPPNDRFENKNASVSKTYNALSNDLDISHVSTRLLERAFCPTQSSSGHAPVPRLARGRRSTPSSSRS